MKNAMKTVCRRLSLVLCLAMVLVYLPASVLAAGVEYTVIYDANGGEGTVKATVSTDDIVFITEETLTREGYFFGGWNTEPDGSGDTYTALDVYWFLEEGVTSVTLYARWSKIFVGNVEVTEDNADNVLGDGTVSYDVSTNTLTLNGATITQGYVYDQDCVAGIYATGALNIYLENENHITAPEANVSSAGIFADGNVVIEGEGSLTVKGGKVENPTSMQGQSIAMKVNGQLYISGASVNALADDANAAGYAFSVGVYACGVSVDYGTLYAQAATATGEAAYSLGLYVENESVDVYFGCLEAVAATACGKTAYALGAYNTMAGIYTYSAESYLILTGGKVENAETAYVNGAIIFGGDFGAYGGTVRVTAGSLNGAENGNADGLYVYAYKDEEGDFWGGYVSFYAGEIVLPENSPNFYSTNVTISAPEGKAVYAQMGVDMDQSMYILSPEGGEIAGQGQWHEDIFDWDYYTVVDGNGNAVKVLEVDLVVYTVKVVGGASSLSVNVPYGWSMNEAWCEKFQVEDFSELIKPTEEGQIFGGCYTDESYETPFTFDDLVEESMTVYVKWETEQTPAEEEPTTPEETEPTTPEMTPNDTRNENDGSNSWVLWVAVAVVAVGAVVVIVVVKKKK